MAKFYNNKELSKLLAINIAKWKRWSREFLPPDPLGGLQSGYARQYSLREAFVVALGGHLVSFLKYTIPEARTILSDLDQWMEAAGYYAFHAKNPGTSDSPTTGVDRHRIYIRTHAVGKGDSAGFAYAIEKIVAVNDGGCERRIHVKSDFIDASNAPKETFFDSELVKFLNLEPFFKKFRQALMV
jgi:hypothetical protein